MSDTIVRMSPLKRAGEGSSRVRAAASIESESMKMAASLVWGFGPG